jgi:hypothetical protein
MPKYSAYKIFSKSNRVNFDQIYDKRYQHLESQKSTIGFIIKYILIWYRLDIVDIYNFINKLSQTLCSLTFAESNAHYIMHEGSTTYYHVLHPFQRIRCHRFTSFLFD